MKIKKLKEKQGITLIALIVTIIVLLILAGVSVLTLAGDNGVLTRTKSAKKAYEIAEIKEEIQLEIIAKQTKNKGEISEDELKEILEKYGTINYDEDEEEIKSITTIKEGYEIAMSDIWTGTATSGIEIINSEKTIVDLSDTDIAIDLTWKKLEKIAEMISQDNFIDKDTTSVTVKVGSKKKKLTVGNYTTVKYYGVEKKVRIIGFNTDTKASGGKAGITFDFATILGIYPMNGGNSNSGGWGSTEMKKIMPEYLNKLTSLDESVQLRDIVKPVIKTYNIGDQKTETATSTDSLWLLAASEIVPKNTDDDRYGWASSNEGVQYKYYALATNETSGNNLRLVKYEDLTNKNSFEWWLRSPPYYGSDMFCAIGIKGGMGAGQTSVHLSVAPGFCI